ncbi:MAG: hypothetical protein WCZ47_00255 [Bacilli bacterium]|jgi:hypothetical protein|nr:hypothetical protein [Bacilli bacterium]NLN80600.1 hypothetical protein [Erysipelotrichia bacterium]
MITISFIGLDAFIVENYSFEHTLKISSLYQIEPKHLNFYAPACAFLHEGIDQTSWNILIRIHAPKTYQKVEKEIANYLHNTLKDLTINQNIEFYYYEPSSRYEFLNDEYPRYLDKENSYETIIEIDEEDEEEIYDGNIFEELDK